jgi:predicted class III extradiol MEMO1 family dioxygenase
MNSEQFFNNGFGADVEKVHRKHVIELMTNFAEHYHTEQCNIAPVVVSEAELPSNKELADIQEKYEDDVESDTSFLYGMIALRKYLSERGN